jgi:DNA-binding MarR family transcriptional regulator
MELYVLTRSGTKMVPLLKKSGRELEADILEYLRMAEGATVEQVADAMNLDQKTAYDKLRSLSANRWVWRKTTKLVQF